MTYTRATHLTLPFRLKSDIVKRKYESEVAWKFKRLMKFEVYPVLGISAVIIFGVLFKDWITNLLPLDRLTQKELLFIGRKLSPVLRFKH